jgi:hypothetical protein
MNAPSRRAFLRAAGTCLALPWLESFGHRAFAAPAPASVPKRLAFLYIPNGVNVDQWQVQGGGQDYALSSTLAPLAPHRADFTLISGLNHENATPGPDGPGDHSRATAVYLTGTRPKKTGGSDIHNGVSVDQVAARHIGAKTRLPSLELTTDGPRSSGRCDSGYSCAYQYNLSWATPTKPIPAEQNPRAVFERLFGAPGEASAARQRLRRSVLDAALDDARGLNRNLTAADREKLDQYLTSVREVERRIEQAERSAPKLPGFTPPAGIPDSYRDHIRAMMDLMVLAFQSDSTRVCTLMLAHDGSNRAFPEIGVPEAHHQLSHHQGNEAKLAKLAQIDRFYTEQLAWCLGRLKEIRDGGHPLLDQTMLVYGGCLSDGYKHLHNNLPIILAGRGGGTLKPGHHLVAPDPTPMCNLFSALLQRLDVRQPQFGDSTGALAGV